MKVSSTGSRDPFTATSTIKDDPLAELKASKWMGFADDMEAIDNERMAEYYYTKVLRDFPNTNAAKEARKRRAEK
jgi:TolA-binding protein